MARFDRIKAGKEKENEACRYLETQGLRTSMRNFRCKFGEIDLIMLERDVIVFVEVRSKNTPDFGTALESINPAKQNKLLKSASYYLQIKKLHHKPCRFDVVAFDNLNGQQRMEWIQNAFVRL